MAFLAVFSCASSTVADASSLHHQHGVGGAASISTASSSGGSGNVVVPITPDNFLGAIAECLEEDKDGACPKYGQESKYGEMKDWNVSEVTDMDYGFHKQESFNGDLSKWDTSSVTSMREMFSGARDFTGSKKGLGNWDTSNVVAGISLKGAAVKIINVNDTDIFSLVRKDLRESVANVEQVSGHYATPVEGYEDVLLEDVRAGRPAYSGGCDVTQDNVPFQN